MDQPTRAADLVTERPPPADGTWATRSTNQHGSYPPDDSLGTAEAFDPDDRNGPAYQDDPGYPDDPADEDLDLLADSNRTPSKLTVVLLAAILAGVAFVGGTIVQKHYGTSSTSAADGNRAAGGAGFSRAGGYGGFGGGGGFGGAGGLGGGTGTGGTGTRTGVGSGAGGAGTGAATDSPTVVGQVVKVNGTTITVKNFAGKTFTVKVPAGTTVTVSSSVSLTGLKAGTPVSVVGTTGADGTVTASSVTARK